MTLGSVDHTASDAVIRTDRLLLRPWRLADARAAFAVHGSGGGHLLGPQTREVRDLAAMRRLLHRWITEGGGLTAPTGRWAVQRADDERLIGGAVLLPLPPGDEDLGIGWHLRPDAGGADYTSECAFALASWAFRHDVDEVFAVVRPDDEESATAARRNGMYWVGETRKYFGRTSQVFRLRAADLDRFALEGHRPPNE